MGLLPEGFTPCCKFVLYTHRSHYRKKDQARVLSDQTIELDYHPEDGSGKKQIGETKTLRLRKVCYQDEKNRYYEFLSNNFYVEAEEIAFLYKKR